MKTGEKQKLGAIIEHELVPGLTETILIYGEIDCFGSIFWNDPHHILDGCCKFVHIYLVKENENREYIDGV